MFFLFVTNHIEAKKLNIKAGLPMTNSTPSNRNSQKLFELKQKLVRPSEDTLFFLQLFARMYEPRMAMGIA